MMNPEERLKTTNKRDDNGSGVSHTAPLLITLPLQQDNESFLQRITAANEHALYLHIINN
jgi:hypothetical protein